VPDAAPPLSSSPQDPTGVTFVNWVRALVGQRARAGAAPVGAACARAIAALEAGGTVAVGDVSNNLAHLELLAASSLSAVVFYELIGWDPSAAEHVLASADARLASLPQDDLERRGVRVALAAHAPYSVSPRLFAGLRARGGPASLHLAESPAESAFLRAGTGPWPTFLKERGLDVGAPAGKGAVEAMDELGVLHPGLLAVHATQASRADAALLAARGVRVAVCPRSNLALQVGLPALPDLLAAGVDVCVGSDSLASAASLDVLDDVRVLARAFPGVPAARLIELATVAGARALGCSDLGTLTVGHRAALAWVPADAPIQDPHRHVVVSDVPARRVILPDVATEVHP
jgi:cytosine/adenosine deaminase-related metal-dependent hydrolase